MEVTSAVRQSRWSDSAARRKRPFIQDLTTPRSHNCGLRPARSSPRSAHAPLGKRAVSAGSARPISPPCLLACDATSPPQTPKRTHSPQDPELDCRLRTRLTLRNTPVTQPLPFGLTRNRDLL